MIEKGRAILYHVDISWRYFLVFLVFYFLHELKQKSSHWMALTAGRFRY